MINDLDETIKKILVEVVPLDTSEIDVVFDAPTSEWKSSLARPTINCYLYHLVENRELRRNDWEVTNPAPSRGNGIAAYHTAVRKRTPFRIDASYMVTAWANEVEDEHRLLWRTLAALMRYNELPAVYMQGVLAGQEWPMPLKVVQPNSVFKNPSDFWSGMEVPVKPSVDITVTLPLDPELMMEAPLVLTKRVQTFPIRSMDRHEFPTQFGGWVFSGGDGGDDDGEPVAGAEVLIVERATDTRTDERGRFKFDDIPHGRYTLRATTPNGQIERVIQVPGDSYDLVMKPRAERKGSSGGRGPTSSPKSGKPAGGDAPDVS